MTENRFRTPLFVWAGWLIVCLLLQAGPEGMRTRIQGLLQTSTTVGLDLFHQVYHLSNDAAASRSGQFDLDQLAAENRLLAKQVADLKRENSQLQVAAPRITIEAERNLIEYDAVAARIVGQRGDVLSESLQLLISLGKEERISSGELVLSGRGLIIDEGESRGLEPDQLLTAGRALFGRTIQVGKQTSLVQPLTDPQFRMAVRIVRRSSLGVVHGPQGILAGTGSNCRLNEVAATEAVAIGDEVYTDSLVSPGAEPIYCGRVTKADVGPGENHWTIEVTPLHGMDQLPAKLFVLRGILNPERTANLTRD